MDYRNSFSKQNCRSISVSCSHDLMTNGIDFSKSTRSTSLDLVEGKFFQNINAVFR